MRDTKGQRFPSSTGTAGRAGSTAQGSDGLYSLHDADTKAIASHPSDVFTSAERSSLPLSLLSHFL